jgi:hypothetical protein
MTASSLCSSRTLVVAGLALAALAGCVEEKPGVRGTTSLAVHIIAPTELGTEAAPIDALPTVTLSIQAIDAQGSDDTTFDRTLLVYTHSLGTLTPPARQVNMVGGQVTVEVTMPSISFGPTYLWAEDSLGDTATYATGTSEILWFRQPFLEDISTPDPAAPSTALERSPLEGKQVRIATSKFGATGRLVVTGVYTQGYTLSDVGCDDFEIGPCHADPFNHVFVFSFGRPRDELGNTVEVGQTVPWVSGGVGEFNGFTELNFPATGGVTAAPDLRHLPEPVVLDPDWLLSPLGANGMINLEAAESGLVVAENATVCPLDDEFEMYSQWKLDVGNGCGDPINVITAGAVSSYDETAIRALVGDQVTVVGTLRAVNIRSFHVWILYPRFASDIVVN